MKRDLMISNARLDESGYMHVTISGHSFWAGEKYTILEIGWAIYVQDEEVPEEWFWQYGETRPREKGTSELNSSRGNGFVTSHPVLVTLALKAWGHQNGSPIPTAPDVPIPSFDEAVEQVRHRKILNDFNRHHVGIVPGLEHWRGGPA